HALAVGGPQVAVAGDLLDVGVTADHPVAAVFEDRVGLLVPPHRRGLAQLGEFCDGDALHQDVWVGEVIPTAEGTSGLRHTESIHCNVKCMAEPRPYDRTVHAKAALVRRPSPRLADGLL